MLLVPVHLDALIVESAREVAPPSADFARLPHVAEGRDVNGDVPWLGEAIAAAPLETAPLTLAAGLHLHWALPDALCRTTRAEGEGGTARLTFPAVPDRWLITRRWQDGTGVHEARWLIESNYLHPAGARPLANPVAYPWPVDLAAVAPGDVPFRYLGRTVAPPPRVTALEPGAAYLEQPLTAIGYGDPTFAAFYPNSRGVFGFHDDSVPFPLPAELSYELLGWYADPASDHLRTVAARPAAPARDALLAELGWAATAAPLASAGDAAADALPLLVCQARLTVPGGRPTTALRLPPPSITVGNTTAEALAAYLAAHTASATASPAQLEDQLKAILLAPQLEQRQTDIGPKFDEARHAQGFAAAPPAHLWAIRPASDDPRQEAPLPDWPDVSELLDQLNGLQRAYNAAADTIRQRRRQLMADWHRYLLCAYPPDGDPTRRLDADAIRARVEGVALPELERLVAETGELLGENAAVRVGPRTRSDALASRIVAAAAAVQRRLDEHLGPLLFTPLRRPDEPRVVPPTRFVLQRYVAPRYFAPTEPVLLLTGDAMKPNDRYGRAGTSGGRLACRWFACPGLPGTHFDAITAELTTARGWDARAWSAPWHPFAMEWEVEIRPWSRFTAGRFDSRTYDADFVTRNFTLLRSDVELSARSEQPALAREGFVYRGRSLLTPHGVEPLLAALQAEYDHGDLRLVPEGEDEDGPGLGDIITDETDGDAYRKGLKQVRDALVALPMMAQALSGLNDALLMNRVVLQLPVAHPLGFADERALAARVRRAIDGRVQRAPEPALGFLPIRAGRLRLRRLRVIDTFGQTLDVDCESAPLLGSRTLPVAADRTVLLPPRLVQPARLHFRWHAAARPARETHAHPDTTPIAGWVTVDRADRSLYVHDADGSALGYLEVEGLRVRWRSAPGREPPLEQLDAGIDSPILRRWVRFLLVSTPAFFEQFLVDVEAAQDLIEPEDAGDALLLGRPLALVRACLQLQLQGPPAQHQGWFALAAALAGAPPSTDGFESVRFPVRLGDQRQLGDGTTVYFAEDAEGGYDGYVIPDYSSGVDPDVAPADRKCDFLYLAPDGPPLMVTMLVDPRGKFHAASGVLPTKVIDIPPHQYREAMQRLETSFLAAPLLAERDATSLDAPLVAREGRAWVFVEKRGDHDQPPQPVRPAPLHVPFAAPIGIREGWLRLTPDPRPAGGDRDD